MQIYDLKGTKHQPNKNIFVFCEFVVFSRSRNCICLKNNLKRDLNCIFLLDMFAVKSAWLLQKTNNVPTVNSLKHLFFPFLFLDDIAFVCLKCIIKIQCKLTLLKKCCVCVTFLLPHSKRDLSRCAAINQSTNQSINQSINHTIIQSINQKTFCSAKIDRNCLKAPKTSYMKSITIYLLRKQHLSS